MTISKIDISMREMIDSFMVENWGSTIMISRGRQHDLSKIEGFVEKHKGEIRGIVTYNIESEECEIVSLDSMVENQGIGSKLLNCVLEEAKLKKINRLWLITTNDNLRAMGFYQRRGFDMCEFHRDAVTEARKLKPEIPMMGNDNIPIKHEIEFEKII